MEPVIFEPTASTTPDSAPHIESTAFSQVYQPLDDAIRAALSSVTLAQLGTQVVQNSMNGYMYYL